MVDVQMAYENVLEEHRMLRQMIQELRRFLEGPQPSVAVEGSHGWAADLSHQIVRLHHKMFLHVREEDRSGLWEDLADRFPRAARSVEVLQDEHDHLLGEMRAILADSMIFAESKPPPEPDLRGRTLSLLNRMVRHEETENDLIMRVHCEDLGGEQG